MFTVTYIDPRDGDTIKTITVEAGSLGLALRRAELKLNLATRFILGGVQND